MAEVLLAGAGELADRQDNLEEAFGKLLGALSEARGGPWEGRLDLTKEAMIDCMCDQDEGVEELKERIARKQRELARLAEVEEKDETSPRSRVTATATTAPQEAGTLEPGAQKSKIVFKPNSYCLPKRVIFQDIRDSTKHRE